MWPASFPRWSASRCELTRRKVLGFLDFNFSGSGLITGQRLCDILDTRLKGIEIEALSKRFVAVATEIGTGHEIWLSRGRLVDAMRASYALPGIFRPVPINGRWLFDGALVNPVPVSVCRALGARYVIAVNVNWDTCRPRHRRAARRDMPSPRRRSAGRARGGRDRAATAAP